MSGHNHNSTPGIKGKALIIKPVKWLLLSLLLLGMIGCAWKTWEQATAYEHQTLQIIQQLQAETQLENSGRELLEALSFGLYDGYSKQLEQLNQQKELQAAYKTSVEQLTALFLLFAGSFMLIAWLAQRKAGDLGYAMLTISVIALAVGLTTPILSVEASKELPVLGDTVLQFQSKGILTTITGLWEHGNQWLALLLLMFSVLLPLLKTTVAWLTLFSRTHHISLQGLHLSRHLGKWSMADVFVVAILVVFFSSNQGGLTQAEVQAGLWFFAIYVVLSLLGSQLIAKALKQLPELNKPSME
ncbi:MAG: paraquat-inducible protein A [Sedimenticola thiotaurini]|uniref:Paraquat-inducible protein A n=1 Tax=Sedimenticola thiotaurini TaxID=1543721 RepID=A0A558DFF0_9GAMM|nr:MAG: paraquat-inducible protein A [Sedimenticola thiotaurini]